MSQAPAGCAIDISHPPPGGRSGCRRRV